MRAIGRREAKRRCWALPKWRMKRLELYLAANIDRRISLDDMAAAVGLSKMHFAAQFRAATDSGHANICCSGGSNEPR